MKMTLFIGGTHTDLFGSAQSTETVTDGFLGFERKIADLMRVIGI